MSENKTLIQLASEMVGSVVAWAAHAEGLDRRYWELQWDIDGYERDLDVWENLRRRATSQMVADLAAADVEITSLRDMVDELEADLHNEYLARKQAEQTVEEQRWQIMALLQQVGEATMLLGPKEAADDDGVGV